MTRLSDDAKNPKRQVFRYKVVLVGPQGVGKTSLVRRFIEKKFELNYLPSIGSNVMLKNLAVPLPGQKGTADVSLNIWDIASHDLFTQMRPTFYTGAQGAFLVVDLTRPASFEEIINWRDELRQYTPDIPAILLANKCDLVPDIPESNKDIGKKVGGVKAVITSAKSGVNVDEAFQSLAGVLVKKTLEKM